MDAHLLHSSQLENNSKRDCSACPIRHNAICSRCQPDELNALDQMKTYRMFEKGEAITHIGENMAYVGSLVSGVAAISKSLEDGRKQILGILLPSDFVGRPVIRFQPMMWLPKHRLRCAAFLLHHLKNCLTSRQR